MENEKNKNKNKAHAETLAYTITFVIAFSHFILSYTFASNYSCTDHLVTYVFSYFN